MFAEKVEPSFYGGFLLACERARGAHQPKGIGHQPNGVVPFAHIGEPDRKTVLVQRQERPQTWLYQPRQGVVGVPNFINRIVVPVAPIAVGFVALFIRVFCFYP